MCWGPAPHAEKVASRPLPFFAAAHSCLALSLPGACCSSRPAPRPALPTRLSCRARDSWGASVPRPWNQTRRPCKLLSARPPEKKRDSSQTCPPPRRCVWVSVPLFFGSRDRVCPSDCPGRFLGRRRPPTAGRRGAPKLQADPESSPVGLFLACRGAPARTPPAFSTPGAVDPVPGTAQLGGWRAKGGDAVGPDRSARGLPFFFLLRGRPADPWHPLNPPQPTLPFSLPTPSPGPTSLWHGHRTAPAPAGRAGQPAGRGRAGGRGAS